MDGDERQYEREAAKRGGWYVIKGIPIAVIVTLASTLIPQTVAVTWFLSSLATKLESVQEKQSESGVKLDRADVKIDALNSVVQNGSVPTALNQRRIEEVERQQVRFDAELSQLATRVSENERKLAAESMRNRASRER
jgi:NAD/NADP transhydrogenase beta subunit